MATDDGPRTHFFVMRHAATIWNLEGRIQGQADSPLAPASEAQLGRWHPLIGRLEPEAMGCSDLGRAQATARGLNRGRELPLTIEPRLREQDWGRWSGRVHKRLRHEDAHEYTRQVDRGWAFRPPGGESYLDVLERALAALGDLAARHRGRRVLVVTHEGVLKCLVYHLAIRDGCGRKPAKMAAGHLHHLVHSGRRLFLKRMNALNLDR